MYGFFFDYEGETVRLPINTGKLTTKVGNKNKTIDIISLGEVNLLKEIGLTDFSFRALLPGSEYPFIHTGGDFRLPEFYIDKFRSYKINKKPVRFIVTRTLPDDSESFGTNILVSFEDYSYDESAGEEGDVWIDLRLKEYRPIGTKILSVEETDTETGTALATETVVRPSRESTEQYTVVSGDSLWAVARRELGDGSRYAEIASLNGIRDPDLIFPGQVLKLP